MLRLAELMLFVAPVAGFALWRLTFARGPGPSPFLLSVILAGLLLFGAGLAWFGVHERVPAGQHYVPAQVRDGQIVPGHGE